jgi:glycosyltransferase involved in cell wall biosynthesis
VVDTDLFTPARRHSSNALVNIGYVGALTVEENVCVLQDVEADLDAEGLDVRLTLVGEGSEREWLARHMLRAEFTGTLRGEALATAYAHMDLLAFTSETRTAADVVLEATACGVPVVMLGTGGFRSLVEPSHAIVAADAGAFVRGVRALVKNPERRRAMSAAARARALQMFSWYRLFDEACNAYETAMQSAGSLPKECDADVGVGSEGGFHGRPGFG